MGRPYIDFEEVSEKISLPMVFERLGLLDGLTLKNGVYSGRCPLPQHQHNGIHTNDQQFKADNKRGVWLYKCFGDCSEAGWHGGGDVINFVKAHQQLSDSHAALWFHREFGNILSTTKGKRKPKAKQTPAATVTKEEAKPESKTADASEAKPKPLKPLRFFLNLDPTVPYLKERGVPLAQAKEYGAGLCTRGTLRDHVCFPVYRWPKESSDEHPVGYIGRHPKPEEGQPRYKVPADFEIARSLFGVEQALAIGDAHTPLFVVEGVFACLHLARLGFAAVSTFKSSVSDAQADLLVQTRRPIGLVFDGDESGQQGNRTAVAKLSFRTFVKRVLIPDGQKPDEIPPDSLKALLRG